MAEQVPMSGFGVPPLPQSAQVSERPSAGNMQPGFVPPAPAPAPAAPAPAADGMYTQAQVDAMIAAAKAPAAAPAPGPAANPSSLIQAPALEGSADPVLKSYTEMFIASSEGLDLDRVVGKALAFGDASLIDIAYLQEKGGARAANLITMAQAIVQRVQSQAEAGEQAAYAAAGDKAAWHAAASVFDQSAPAHTKMVVKQMLDSGNAEAVAAAAKTVVEFAQKSGQVVNRPGLLHAGAGGSGTAQALSKVDFQTEHAKLNTNDPAYTAKRGELFNRRALGKSLGI